MFLKYCCSSFFDLGDAWSQITNSLLQLSYYAKWILSITQAKSRTYAGSYERHGTAPVVNEEQCQYWSLVPRQALARYWFSMESKCWLEADLGIYAERWHGTGLAMPQYAVQVLAGSRLRDLCWALARYWLVLPQ